MWRVSNVSQRLAVTTFYISPPNLQVWPRWHPKVQKCPDWQQKVLCGLRLERPGPDGAGRLEVGDHHDEQLWEDGRVSEVPESRWPVLHVPSWGDQVPAEGRGSQPRWLDANADGTLAGEENFLVLFFSTSTFRMGGRLTKTCHWDGSWNLTGQSILQSHHPGSFFVRCWKLSSNCQVQG